MFRDSSASKTPSEPKAPFFVGPHPFQDVFLPMPSQEGGNSCFVSDDIWVAVNTATLKIDV